VYQQKEINVYKFDGNQVTKDTVTAVVVPMADVPREVAYEFVRNTTWGEATFSEWLDAQYKALAEAHRTNLLFCKGEIIHVKGYEEEVEWSPREFVGFSPSGCAICKVPYAYAGTNDVFYWPFFKPARTST
jgi:hypothetical protein